MASELATLYWTTNKEAHPWVMLILPLPAVLSCLGMGLGELVPST